MMLSKEINKNLEITFFDLPQSKAVMIEIGVNPRYSFSMSLEEFEVFRDFISSLMTEEEEKKFATQNDHPVLDDMAGDLAY